MSVIEIFAIAVALAMDAFAVAVATGLNMRCSLAQTLRMALAFGVFQFLMPVAGWYLGISVRSHIENYDHWAAFALLLLVGGKMLHESFRGGEEKNNLDPTRGFTLLLLAVATSIDALAVGISMAMLGADILYPAGIIGVVCFSMTAAGMHMGRVIIRTNSSLSRRVGSAGGLVLIGIGIKILMEHGVFHEYF